MTGPQAEETGLAMYRILQLSDIHFGAEHAFAQEGRPPTARNFSEAILGALDDNSIETGFDALVLSGDVFSQRDSLERTEARLQLTALARAVSARQIVMVPGNHDVDWTAPAPDRLYDYDQLAVDLSALGRPSQLPELHVVSESDARPLVIAALNSCMLESESQRGLGLVGDQQLDSLARLLADGDITAKTATLVATLHHHLLPVATVPALPGTADPNDSNRLTVSLTVDAAIVLNRLAELGFSLVLHGHQHVPVVMQFSVSRWRRPLYVAAAGSAGLRKEEVRRHFFIWELDDALARVTSFRHREDEPGRFELDPDNSGDFPLS
jgi:3',5'-cyclic AMP phosphodiesterase CpdA